MSPPQCQPEGAMLIKLSDRATAVFFFVFFLSTAAEWALSESTLGSLSPRVVSLLVTVSLC